VQCETENMARDTSASLRQHLDSLLRMEGAHIGLRDAVAGFPVQLRGAKPHGAPHSAWQLLEHMRLGQEDILDFIRNPDYQERTFPDDYWPKADAPPSEKAWDESVRQFEKDLNDVRALVADEKHDLFEPIPHGQGQTLLREALLVADHNSYHLGQLMFVRKVLQAK
jgi:hypothetical protein